jgi:MFS family permease
VRSHTLDLAGATLLSCALCAVLVLLSEGGQGWPWLSAPTVVLGLITLVGLALFVSVERRAAEPVVPLDLFRNRIIAVSSVAMVFAGALMVSVSFVVPLFVQGVLGQDAFYAGLALVPMSLGWPLAAALSGRLALRWGYRVTAVAGLLSCVMGLVLLLTLTMSSSILAASASSVLVGIGLGLSSTPLLIAVQSAVPWTRRGVATATNMFVRSFGSVVGLAVMGALVNTATRGSAAAANRALGGPGERALSAAALRQVQTNLFGGIHATFVAALVCALLGLLVVCALPGGSARDHAFMERAEDQKVAPATPVGSHSR